MAQKKAHEADAWISRPEPGARIVLIYGTDRGVVSERARKFAAATGIPLDDPFATIRMDADALASEPGNLIDEARMVSMFGGQRLIWVTGGGTQKGLVSAVKVLVEEPPTDCVILIEAGDLKKGATTLRGIVESASSAMALPCYADDARKLDQIINEELAAARMTITLEARELLKSGLGGDRLASRGEIAKLVLYAMGKPQITVEDVAESIGDVAASSADDAVDAAITGRIEDLDIAVQRLLAGGSPPFLLLSAAMRRFAQLQELRLAVETAGKTVQAAVASARPPVFFARRPAMEAALGAWTGSAIGRILDRLQQAILDIRRTPSLEAEMTRQAMLAIAVESIRARRL
ncbi:DNA polymerase III subunit delta [Zhengella mangrovi]|uniref:DNA-directed DNA polymerase n=1 Tax=Zhengella mangrovi TaxID=1982044 RepID=A0A2G1QST6_9HYPH|nr:DNA polymerase III subunit delta [Zhengella mangrovi]PHP68606.1 DNA polymerase III subunit delta [Zhengella mangrovi]